MLVNSKRLASDGRLIDLEESIFGNNAAVGGNNSTLDKLALVHWNFIPFGDLLLQSEEYHQAQLRGLRFPAACRRGEPWL